MCCCFKFEIAFFALLFQASLLATGKYSCAWEIGYTISGLCFSILLMRLSLFLATKNICPGLWRLVATISGVMMGRFGATSLIYMWALGRDSRHCIPLYIFIPNWILIGTVNGIFLLIALFTVFLCIYFCCAKRIQEAKKERQRQALDDLYHQIMNPDFDYDNFVVENPNLHEFKMDEKELSLLNDYFGAKYGKDQTNIPENDLEECAICLSAFELESNVISHPKCNHKFHKDCLEHWMQVGTSEQSLCPICKACTRTEMIASIRRDLMKRQPEVSMLSSAAN